ncbi:hypothetical protein GOEFS_059_00040 [Gordonia effusa NBRC 100432]|uniref:Uncharacterized protein n=1 Tax=Gordonia effusa NBRC 100432 TaxID=1077974 RepID=H0R0G9_9ACTN|nr:hypothetical protein GOEFS_059_00040 [Gordonia effusa NBRC 100432]
MSNDEAGTPANWIAIIGARTETPPLIDEGSEPQPVDFTVCSIGFAGPLNAERLEATAALTANRPRLMVGDGSV